MSQTKAAILLTCEHGGNQIPTTYKDKFKNQDEILNTHRGLDIGALEIAELMQRKLKTPLIYSTTSRLVVDLNRTLKNPTLFSEFTEKLPKEIKNKILEKFYFPHWHKVRQTVQKLKKSNERIVHIAVHSMTDELNGQKRKMHLALLYHPAFKAEVRFASLWIKELRKEFPDFIIARNKPYRGDGDGLTFVMRKENSNYIGIEIEMNQKMLRFMTSKEKARLALGLARSLKTATRSVLMDSKS